MEMYVMLQLVNVVYVNLDSSETSAIKVNKNAYENSLDSKYSKEKKLQSVNVKTA